MKAVALRRVELVPDPRERDILLVQPDAGDRAGLDLVHPRNRPKTPLSHAPILTLEE